jgi:hypothetical protein
MAFSDTKTIFIYLFLLIYSHLLNRMILIQNSMIRLYFSNYDSLNIILYELITVILKMTSLLCDPINTS